MVVGLVILAVPVTVFAYDTYVGLKIESVYNPNVGSPTTWCLPSGETTMTTGNNGVDDIVTTTTTTGSDVSCGQNTIWSNLVDLTVDSIYTIELSMGKGGGTGTAWNGLRWFMGGHNESCLETCEGHGGPQDVCHENDNDTCDLCKLAFGAPAGWACESHAGTYAPTYAWGHNKCFYRSTGNAGNCETDAPYYHYALCACNGELIFIFSFQAPAE